MRVHQTSRVPAAAASHQDHKLCSKRQLPVFDLCLNFEFPFVFSVNSSAYRFILQEETVLVFFFFLPPSPTPSRGWPHFYRFPPAIFSTLRSSHMSFYTYFWVPFGRRRALNCEAINDCKWFEHSPGKGDLPHYAASLRTDHQRPWENTLPLEHPQSPEHHPMLHPGEQQSSSVPWHCLPSPCGFFTARSAKCHSYH